MPTDQTYDLSGYLEAWGPVISAITAASGGDEAAAVWVQEHLLKRSQQSDWAALAGVLRRMLAGERDPEQLLGGLDPIDTAIVQRTLDVLAGRVELPADEADAWRALALLKDWRPVIDTVVAAAGGDQEATSELASFLDELEQQPDWAALARVLRQLAAGTRDPGLLEGLDPADQLITTTVLEELDDKGE
jgi:hypothetical protein